MATYPTFPTSRGFEILKNIEKRLLDKDCPLHNKHKAVMEYLCSVYCTYSYDFKPASSVVLDSFLSNDGKYDIYICQSRVYIGYRFYYSESEKYKMLKKMGD